MKQLIKNYTTEIPVDQTIAEIQKILALNGARGIALEYHADGRIKDIFFKILRNGKELPFRLPAKANHVYTALHKGTPDHYHTRYGKQWEEEAEQIAWRICKTWLEAQITLINLEQAKLEEVFLPYLLLFQQGGRTHTRIEADREDLLPVIDDHERQGEPAA